ncbi:hypothetical protein DVH24_034155 [Malus domestica]|uniref:Aminotransferase-like plant mobile domain-containing protein n=1 Tax=Malus domestica TaxID=3750 RepID=A0A498I5E1_MALDO|nr:hypothetical protein DVH24_034155 [Malus domestica]
MEEMRSNVVNAHHKLMNRTPFRRLFKAYHENLINDGVCRKCDANIYKAFFFFCEITATITAKDVAEIFGLPYEGEEINLNSRKRKSILEERILRVVKLPGSVHEGDFVRLVCLYLCLALFFNKSGNNTSLYMVGYVEDTTKMKGYVWTVAVNNWLLDTWENVNESVTSCVMFCECTHLINPISRREHLPLKEVVQVDGGSPKTPEKERKILQLHSHCGG